MSDQIRVNGVMMSWGSITLKIDGEPFSGFTSIAYTDSRERVKAWGMGRHHAPRGRSRGKYTVDPVRLAGPKSTMEALRETLAASSADGISYGDVPFQIVVEYSEADEPPITVEIEDCVISKVASTEEENPDPLKEEIEIDAMKIWRNGRVLFDASQGAP